MNTTLRNPVEHRSPTSEDRRGYAVLVAELDDVVPRRHPDLPNLYVGVTVERPEVKLDRIDAGAKPRWARNHVVRLREDLCAVNEKLTREGAADRKSALSKELSRQGYTVNGDRTGVWNLYVVQLDEEKQVDVGKGWVYVGESSLQPEARLAQHLSGSRNGRGPLFSRVVHRHGQHLRRDLMQDLPTLYSMADSKKAEAELAERLRAEGYRVEGGH